MGYVMDQISPTSPTSSNYTWKNQNIHRDLMRDVLSMGIYQACLGEIFDYISLDHGIQLDMFRDI